LTPEKRRARRRASLTLLWPWMEGAKALREGGRGRGRGKVSEEFLSVVPR